VAKFTLPPGGIPKTISRYGPATDYLAQMRVMLWLLLARVLSMTGRQSASHQAQGEQLVVTSA
jgi:hypothetical protein